jgi:hypothetical protein
MFIVSSELSLTLHEGAQAKADARATEAKPFFKEKPSFAISFDSKYLFSANRLVL